MKVTINALVLTTAFMWAADIQQELYNVEVMRQELIISAVWSLVTGSWSNPIRAHVKLQELSR